MKKSRIVRSGFRVMGRHKLRSFFMMVGIVLGVTILTLVMSLGRGMEKKVMSSLKMLFNSSNILISAGGRADQGHTPADRARDDDADPGRFGSPPAGSSRILLCDPMQTIAAREVSFRERIAATRISGSPNVAEWSGTAA